MLDTLKNSQLMENSREAELLRQQEAFINQNRMHIEKRRRSREHSPERDREYRERDRERERSYSPRRRERKPYQNFRENRGRRADSRERDQPPDMKRKRNENDGNAEKNDPKVSDSRIEVITMICFRFRLQFINDLFARCYRLTKMKRPAPIGLKLKNKRRNERKYCGTRKCAVERPPKI